MGGVDISHDRAFYRAVVTTPTTSPYQLVHRQQTNTASISIQAI